LRSNDVREEKKYERVPGDEPSVKRLRRVPFIAGQEKELPPRFAKQKHELAKSTEGKACPREQPDGRHSVYRVCGPSICF